MKIIGNVGNDAFLVEISANELARIDGFYSAYSRVDRERSQGGRVAFKVGDEINISAMYDQITKLGENKNRLSRIAAELHAFADRLVVHDPVVRELVFEKKPEPEPEPVEVA